MEKPRSLLNIGKKLHAVGMAIVLGLTGCAPKNMPDQNIQVLDTTPPPVRTINTAAQCHTAVQRIMTENKCFNERDPLATMFLESVWDDKLAAGKTPEEIKKELEKDGIFIVPNSNVGQWADEICTMADDTELKEWNTQIHDVVEKAIKAIKENPYAVTGKPRPKFTIGGKQVDEIVFRKSNRAERGVEYNVFFGDEQEFPYAEDVLRKIFEILEEQIKKEMDFETVSIAKRSESTQNPNIVHDTMRGSVQTVKVECKKKDGKIFTAYIAVSIYTPYPSGFGTFKNRARLEAIGYDPNATDAPCLPLSGIENAIFQSGGRSIEIPVPREKPRTSRYDTITQR